MKKFFFSHPDVTLVIIALILLGTLIGFFSWGINVVVDEVSQSSQPASGQSTPGFNLQGAQTLLSPSTSTAPTH